MNFTKSIINENIIYNSYKLNNEKKFTVFLSKSTILNNNLPNFENHNGLYAPKGLTTLSSILFFYRNKNLFLSIEPEAIHLDNFSYNDLPLKKGAFKYLNDVPLGKYEFNYPSFKNMGIKLKYKNFRLGYGNWNLWWGAGVHNSLSLTNNSQGFNHFFVSIEEYLPLIDNFKIKYKYLVSEKMVNTIGNNYSIAFSMMNINIMNLELGVNFTYLIGGYDGYKNDSILIFPTNINNYTLENSRQSHYYISYNDKSSGLIVFYEFGFPDRFYFTKQTDLRYENSMGTNIGVRKKGLFYNSNL